MNTPFPEKFGEASLGRRGSPELVSDYLEHFKIETPESRQDLIQQILAAYASKSSLGVQK